MGKVCGICTTMWPMGLTARQSDQPFEAVDSDCDLVLLLKEMKEKCIINICKNLLGYFPIKY